MLVAKYKTKKALKEALGQALMYEETSVFGQEYTSDGQFAVVGPGAYERKWYATVIMSNDIIIKVK